MSKKQSFFDFFQFSQKLAIRFERNFLQLFYTSLESYMCNGIKTYCWDVRNIAKNSPNMAKKQPFFDFFSILSKTDHTIRTKFSTVILHHIRVLYVQWHQNRMAGMWETAKVIPKMAKKQPFFDFFCFSQNLSIRFERNFPQLFYTILKSCMCNGIRIVWLGCEKHSQN